MSNEESKQFYNIRDVLSKICEEKKAMYITTKFGHDKAGKETDEFLFYTNNKELAIQFSDFVNLANLLAKDSKGWTR